MWKNNPTVSIIIPTYNRSDLINRALHSVLNQSYENIEVIIVDDASTDNTENKIRSISDSRIRYIRHDSRMGASAARNTGIELSSADFIAFQDSDDEWLGQKLEKQMAVFEEQGDDVGVVYTSFIRVEENHATYFPAKREYTSGNILESLLKGNFITTQSVVVRKKCFEHVGFFDEKLPRFQDWEFFIRIAKHFKIIHLDEPLVVAFHSKTSITATNSLYPVALESILTKHADIFSTNTKIYSKYYYRLGKSYCEISELNKGIAHYKFSLKTNPFQIICFIMLISAMSGERIHNSTSYILKKINQIMQ